MAAINDGLTEAEARVAKLEGDRDHFIRYTENNIDFYAERVEEALLSLERYIGELRREVENGAVFEQNNLITAAARVAPVEVRVLHNEVLVRGIEAAEKARGQVPQGWGRSS
jgi:DNA integrity scanning protein DisA with diadenylate cyclase activity